MARFMILTILLWFYSQTLNNMYINTASVGRLPDKLAEHHSNMAVCAIMWSRSVIPAHSSSDRTISLIARISVKLGSVLSSSLRWQCAPWSNALNGFSVRAEFSDDCDIAGKQHATTNRSKHAECVVRWMTGWTGERQFRFCITILNNHKDDRLS